jgi:hypothetical protein
LSGQALELLELALVKLDSSDTLKLTHGSGLQTFALLAGIDALGCPGERPPGPRTAACRAPDCFVIVAAGKEDRIPETRSP